MSSHASQIKCFLIQLIGGSIFRSVADGHTAAVHEIGPNDVLGMAGCRCRAFVHVVVVKH